ncbi:hypothetical protein O3M35_006221 [Rhynocoris fuscipes]|uniref:Uncharacterized protein n=1 Tax=Rhynocoris fuscipes TaxID=488301 RepID=A0AAW1DJV2_9HEMI
MEDPPKFAICLGKHPANYKGCIVHKELQRQRRPTEPIYNHPSALRNQAFTTNLPPLPQSTSFPPLPEPTTHSSSSRPSAETSHRSEAAWGPPPLQPPTQTNSPSNVDITNTLNSFLNGFVDNPVDREKRNLSSLKPEDLLPESPEIKRNLQHQSVR